MSNKTKRANPPTKKPKRLNTTEFIYALTGWLTTRERPIIFSSKHDAAPIAKLVGAFCDENRLPSTRPDSPGAKIPEHLNHLSNEPAQQMSFRQPTPEEVVKEMKDKLDGLDSRQQNVAIAKLLDDIKRQRLLRYEAAQRQKLGSSIDEQVAYETYTQFTNILNGNFSVI